jgi:4-hydroxy-tetrahydrodipicolinate synthase
MHLAAREREQHATETVQHVNQRVPVIVGTGTTSTAETVRLSRHAQGVGADAVAVITPYFWTLSEREIIAHISAVANAVDIAVVVYNFPAYSGINITSETLATLVKEHPNIAGVKDSLDDLEHLRRRVAVVKSMKSDFSVLTGADGLLLAALEIGCDGAVPATANIAPHRHVAVWEAHSAGDHARAIDNMLNVNQLLDIYRIPGSFHSVVKVAMEQVGLAESHTARQPALPLSADSRANVSETLERAGLVTPEQDPRE